MNVKFSQIEQKHVIFIRLSLVVTFQSQVDSIWSSSLWFVSLGLPSIGSLVMSWNWTDFWFSSLCSHVKQSNKHKTRGSLYHWNSRMCWVLSPHYGLPHSWWLQLGSWIRPGQKYCWIKPQYGCWILWILTRVCMYHCIYIIVYIHVSPRFGFDWRHVAPLHQCSPPPCWWLLGRWARPGHKQWECFSFILLVD